MDVLAKKVTFGNGVTLPAGIPWMAFDGDLDKVLKAHRTTIVKFAEDQGITPVKQKKDGRMVAGLFIRDVVAIAKHRTKQERPAFDEKSWSKASNGTAIVFTDAALPRLKTVRVIRPVQPKLPGIADPTLDDVLTRLFYLEDLVEYLVTEWGKEAGIALIAKAKLSNLGARRR